MPGLVPLLSGLTSVDRVQGIGRGGFPALPPDRDTDRGPPSPAILVSPAVTPDLIRGPGKPGEGGACGPRIGVRDRPGPRIKSGVTARGGDGPACRHRARSEVKPDSSGTSPGMTEETSRAADGIPGNREVPRRAPPRHADPRIEYADPLVPRAHGRHLPTAMSTGRSRTANVDIFARHPRDANVDLVAICLPDAYVDGRPRIGTRIAARPYASPHRHARTCSGHPRLAASRCGPGTGEAAEGRGCPEQVRA